MIDNDGHGYISIHARSRNTPPLAIHRFSESGRVCKAVGSYRAKKEEEQRRRKGAVAHERYGLKCWASKRAKVAKPQSTKNMYSKCTGSSIPLQDVI